MLVYVNGDSFAAGDELYDPSFSQWPGLTSIDNFKFNEQWYVDRRKLITASNLDLETENKKRAWPGKLEKFNHSVINSSVPGSSMEAIVRRTILDLEEHTPDIVLIQITAIPRVTVISEYTDYYALSCPIFNVKNISINSPVVERHRRLLVSKSLCYSDKELAIDYLSWMHILNTVVKSKLGKYPIYLDSRFASSNKFYIDQLTTESENKLLKLSRATSIDSNNMEIFDSKLNQSRLVMPLGHYQENVHDEFAKYVNERYLQDV